MPKIVCIDCGLEKEHLAKKRCVNCYQNYFYKNNPKYRKYHLEYSRKYYHNPKNRIKLSKYWRKYYQIPKNRIKRNEYSRKYKAKKVLELKELLKYRKLQPSKLKHIETSPLGFHGLRIKNRIEKKYAD